MASAPTVAAAAAAAPRFVDAAALLPHLPPPISNHTRDGLADDRHRERLLRVWESVDRKGRGTPGTFARWFAREGAMYRGVADNNVVRQYLRADRAPRWRRARNHPPGRTLVSVRVHREQRPGTRVDVLAAFAPVGRGRGAGGGWRARRRRETVDPAEFSPLASVVPEGPPGAEASDGGGILLPSGAVISSDSDTDSDGEGVGGGANRAAFAAAAAAAPTPPAPYMDAAGRVIECGDFMVDERNGRQFVAVECAATPDGTGLRVGTDGDFIQDLSLGGDPVASLALVPGTRRLAHVRVAGESL